MRVASGDGPSMRQRHQATASEPPLRARHPAPPPDRHVGKCLVIGTVDQLADGQAAADPAVVSISASPSMTSQPWEAA